MKILCLNILIFAASVVLAQKIETTISSVNGGRTKYSIAKYEYNNLVSEIWYCEEESKTLGLSDYDVFAKALRRSRRIDSVLLYVYDENWNLVTTRAITDFDYYNLVNIVPQIEVEELGRQFNSEKVEFLCLGRINQSQTVKINIKNFLSQNGWIRASTSDISVTVPKLEVELRNRTTTVLEVNINMMPGENSSEVILLNSNGEQQSVAIKTVGFHLMANDFVQQDELIYAPELEINGGAMNYIEGEGNSKLVRIHGQNDILEYPLSRKITILPIDLLRSGKYIFELVDLETNDRKYRMINVN